VTWALVTGGSGDIGAAVCRRLAADGHDVVVHTFRAIESAEEVASKVRAEGRKSLVVRGHLGREHGGQTLAEEVVDRTGGVDVLVSNAASGVLRPVSELTERHLDWSWEVNTRPLLALAATLRPRATVALSSSGASKVLPHYTGVGVSKAALEALVRYLAVELAPASRVNAICAGIVDTRALAAFPQGGRPLLDEATERTPAGRLVTPDDVATAVSWLAGPESSMVTGHVLVVDGGRSLLA
jgi:enoyl-[acyl-carrier protein] reductase III